MDVEQVILFIDNSAPVLARLLRRIRLAIQDKQDTKEAVKNYINTQAVVNLRILGDKADRQNAPRFVLALNNPVERDWKELADHYIDQHNEGARMWEYLTEDEMGAELGGWIFRKYFKDRDAGAFVEFLKAQEFFKGKTASYGNPFFHDPIPKRDEWESRLKSLIANWV